MCGIIGYTGTKSAVPRLVQGLQTLEYRGYDSAGVAFYKDGGLKAEKCQGRIAALAAKLGSEYDTDKICCGIGHTRWATHGEPSDRNSHPHGTENVYIVHNGIIENYVELKDFLLGKGYSFSSETDTETAALLLDFFYGETGDPVAAIRKTQETLRGSYAICAIFKKCENQIFAFRKDNPLIVAPGETGIFAASDVAAILKHTNRIRRLEEGEIAHLSADKIEIIGTDNRQVAVEFETVDWGIAAAEKGGYPHFMLKEIHEEPQVIANTLRQLVKGGMPDLGIAELTDERLRRFRQIHIVACGTAMHAGLIGKYAIELAARIPVNVVLASEFRYQNPILGKDDMVIIISQSGETADSLAALRLARERGVYILGVVNVMGSAIAREADSVIYTRAGLEVAVASTKAYSVQLAVMYLLAIKLGFVTGNLSQEETKKLIHGLCNDVPDAIQRALKQSEHCREVAKKYKDSKSIFFIGRGRDWALSCEAALKMKEISYIHCEAYAAGELKHGTISLVTKGVPVFAFATDSDIFEKTVSNIKETIARGARVVVFCSENCSLPQDTAEDVITVPSVAELFLPMVTATLAQLVAYYTSAELGLDVDKPRNLAKSVTVE